MTGSVEGGYAICELLLKKSAAPVLQNKARNF